MTKNRKPFRLGCSYLGRLGRLLIRHSKLLEGGRNEEVEQLQGRIRALANRWVRFRSGPAKRWAASRKDVLHF